MCTYIKHKISTDRHSITSITVGLTEEEHRFKRLVCHYATVGGAPYGGQEFPPVAEVTSSGCVIRTRAAARSLYKDRNS